MPEATSMDYAGSTHSRVEQGFQEFCQSIQPFSLWKFSLSLLRAVSIVILESPIPLFKIWRLGQGDGQNENCYSQLAIYL